MMNVSTSQPPGSGGDRSVGSAAGDSAAFAATLERPAWHAVPRHGIARRSHHAALRRAAFLTACSAWVAFDARQ